MAPDEEVPTIVFLDLPSEGFVPGWVWFGLGSAAPTSPPPSQAPDLDPIVPLSLSPSGMRMHYSDAFFGMHEALRRNNEETALELRHREEDKLYSGLPPALDMYKSLRVADFTPFQCRMCKNTFTSIRGLGKHLQVRTGRAPSCKVWQETIETNEPAPESLQAKEQTQEETAMEFVDADDDEDDKDDKDRLL
ncbi:hypothetical protein FDECE_16646 [Fusarium decemcellulare]|nr:hypothetical protein FDECE_16646 [Fusarium decemcellulare]